ncbi:conserved hypothetical protein [Neospora caninum Liverpool]|uniref:Transmembrane protein n=1 Tax=Neospora caninum (strain Liverpool) TaxID=572307 RepID=F0VCC9_NEOCL|nr:conserved hypothetical protein [Neospora caninum Liverpool]CBZ51263.1 conserved hypothetical protein [Neospora caninum Liverpool]CEL68578.1 TPA: hypothetical protein BN1204_043310 [Neospora caninum Liverpool]|eukprot:XP_003881296.1 conserved hypothetical protein [Neospora caninum Liverpool]
MPQARRRKPHRAAPGHSSATPNLDSQRPSLPARADAVSADSENLERRPSPASLLHPALKHPAGVHQTASTAIPTGITSIPTGITSIPAGITSFDDRSPSAGCRRPSPSSFPSSTDASVAYFSAEAGPSTAPRALASGHALGTPAQIPGDSRHAPCKGKADAQPRDSTQCPSSLSGLPSPATVLLSCGAVVLTWLQDPLVTLVASAVTAASPSLPVSATTDAALAETLDSAAASRNVAVAAVGVSGQLCDGLAALTIGIGIATAVLCSSASKKNETSSEAVNTASIRNAPSPLQSDSENRAVPVAGALRSEDGSTAKLRTEQHRGGFDSSEDAASIPKRSGAPGDSRDIICLRKCIVGVWISAYTGALLSLLLFFAMGSLLAFFFSASSSPLLLFLTRKCISIRLLSLPFSIISLTTKAALLALRDPLPPILSAVAAAASIPLLLVASFFSDYLRSLSDAASSFLPSWTQDLSPPFAAEEPSRLAAQVFENGLTAAEAADYHRIRSFAFIVVFTQMTVAFLLLGRLLQLTLAAVRSQRDTGAEGGAQDAGTTEFERRERSKGTNRFLQHPEGKDTPCKQTEDERSFLVTLLQLPTNLELLEFSPFLASCLVQSFVRVVLYSTMMKVAASWGVKALAAHQVASSVYTVHGLPCEALAQVTQSVLRNAECLASETSGAAPKQAASADGARPACTGHVPSEGRDRSASVSEKRPTTQGLLCGGNSLVCGTKESTPLDLTARRAAVMRRVHRRLLCTAGWMGLAAAASAACVGVSFCFRLHSSSRGLAVTLLALCLASTPALAVLPVTAALEGLLLHAKRLRTIACAYVVSLPLPLVLLLHAHVSGPGDRDHQAVSADGEPPGASPGERDAGDAYNDAPSYGAALVWLLPLVYNIGRAGVYGLAWCRARYEADVAEKERMASQQSRGDALC